MIKYELDKNCGLKSYFFIAVNSVRETTAINFRIVSKSTIIGLSKTFTHQDFICDLNVNNSYNVFMETF